MDQLATEDQEETTIPPADVRTLDMAEGDVDEVVPFLENGCKSRWGDERGGGHI
jgi:hypothetical protein